MVLPATASLPLQLTANGNVAAWQEAVIGNESNGLRLTEVRVNVGDVVKKGEVLAVFSADTVNADVAQAKAALAEARANAAEAQANAKRARAVQASGALSEQQISQYLTAEQTAKARIESAQAVSYSRTCVGCLENWSRRPPTRCLKEWHPSVYPDRSVVFAASTKVPTPSEAVGPGRTLLTVTPVPAVVSAIPRATATCAVLVIP